MKALNQIAALFIFLAAAFGQMPKAAAGPWGEGYFPNLPVQDQDGRELKFYDDVLKGKIVVVNFIYTSCKDICPLATARLALVEEKLGPRMGKDVFFVSMSVDPEVDTPARLKEFADAFNTGPGWIFITGKPDDIKSINRKLGDRSTKPWEHRNEVVLGNDATGEWARDSALGDIERLTFDILQMDPKWRDAPRVTTNDNDNNETVTINDHPGEALFRKICAPCHTVGVGNRVGPDLRGITERRSKAWLSQFIKNPAKFSATGDADARAVDAAFPGVKMPILGLSDNDVSDLLSYLQTANDKLTEGVQATAGEEHSHTHDHSKTTN